jgi:hypothetical protein
VAPALYFEEPTGKRRREIEFQFPRVFFNAALGTVVCQQIDGAGQGDDGPAAAALLRWAFG